MEVNNKVYRFANKKEQLKRVNGFVANFYLIYNLIMLLLLWFTFFRGERTLLFSLFITLILVANAGILLFVNRKNPYSTRLRYISLIALFLVGFLMGHAYADDFVRFLGVFPLVCCILYFDTKFSKIGAGVYAAAMVLLNIVQMGIERTVTGGDAILDQLYVTLCIFMLLVLICLITSIAYRFNHDTLHSMQQEQRKQKAIMDEVISVAGEVRRGTESVMNIVSDLNNSSEVVNGAMRNISDSTQNTAESIQTQTTMTQNIQDSIEKTIESSENMVRVAKHSGELNQQGIQVIEQLKQQSEVIAKTNSGVADSMRALQEQTNAVRSIADTIFSISSQTNLLALNASIESARAGEAGRGFAVVADEIRQLAEKTRQETESIATILGELTQNAEDAANAVSESIQATGAQDEMILRVSQNFEEMNSNVSQLITEIESIDGMLNNLSEANNRIVDNIMTLSATTEEVTASSSQAADMSIENLDHAENAKSELSNVLNVSHQLDKYMDAGSKESQ